jgi:hypothetical protein
MNQTFNVISYGGYIGRAETKVVGTFNTRTEARMKAKGLNGCLSPGDKKYYGMKYTVQAAKTIKVPVSKVTAIDKDAARLLNFINDIRTARGVS